MMLGNEKGATPERGESFRLVAVSLAIDSASEGCGLGWGGGLLSRDSIVMELLSKRSSRLNGNGKSS